MSLQRNVTANLPIVQPMAPANNDRGLGGLASIANLAVGMHQKSQEEARREEAYKLFDEASSIYQEAMDNEKTELVAQRLAENVLKSTSNLEIRRAASGMFWDWSGSTAGRESARSSEERKQEAKTLEERERLRGLQQTAEARTQVINYVNDSDFGTFITMDLKREYGEEQYAKLLNNDLSEKEAEAMRASALNSKQQFYLNKDIQKKALSSSGKEAESAAVLTFQAKRSVAEKLVYQGLQQMVDLRTTDGLTTEVVQEFRDQALQAIALLKTDGNNFNGRMQSKIGVENKALKQAHEQYIEELTGLETHLTGMADKELGRFAEIHKNITEKAKVDILQSIGVSAKFMSLMSDDIAAAMRIQGGEAYKQQMDAILGAVGNNPDEAKAALKGFEKSLLENLPDAAERERTLSNFYRLFDTSVKNGSAKDFTETAKREGVQNLVDIFHVASVSPDKADAKEATKLLNSNKFNDFYKNLDPDQKKTIDFYTSKFNYDAITDNRIGVKAVLNQAGHEKIIYDANSGTFKAVQAGSPVKEIGPFQPSNIVYANIQKQNDDLAKEMNERLDQIKKTKDSQGFFKDMDDKEVSDWVAMSVSGKGLRIEGELTDFTEDHVEAQIKNVPVSEIAEERQKRLEQPQKVFKETTERLRKLSFALQQEGASIDWNDKELVKSLDALNLVPKHKVDNKSTELLEIMQANPNLTYDEALKLQKQSQKGTKK